MSDQGLVCPMKSAETKMDYAAFSSLRGYIAFNFLVLSS